MSSVVSDFASLGLVDPLLRAIRDAGYHTPTPIQSQAIPAVLEGGDLLAAAQTGTGKTAGFVLPILQRLLASPPAARRPRAPRCLILVPTRELAAQVEESVRVYGAHTPIRSLVVFGGVNINPQIQSLARPIDILVATPGRLLDHAGQKTVDLSAVEILVLDEADRMLDMGFIHDIKRVLKLLPARRQNLLFSATFSDEIRTLAHGLLKSPQEVSVARRNTASELVEQSVHLVPKALKRDLLSFLIGSRRWRQVLVFTKTKHGANRLAEQLGKDGIAALAIHGNKSQGARTRALEQFKNGTTPVLVATDIAARGLDIDQLPHVVNYELPNVSEDYVHRIGRTGRAGSPGHAVSLVEPEEVKLLVAIERLIKRSIPRVAVPGYTDATAAAINAAAAREPARAPNPRGQESRAAGAANKPRAGNGNRGARPADDHSKRNARGGGAQSAQRDPRRAEGASVPAGSRGVPNRTRSGGQFGKLVRS